MEIARKKINVLIILAPVFVQFLYYLNLSSHPAAGVVLPCPASAGEAIIPFLYKSESLRLGSTRFVGEAAALIPCSTPTLG